MCPFLAKVIGSIPGDNFFYKNWWKKVQLTTSQDTLEKNMTLN